MKVVSVTAKPSPIYKGISSGRKVFIQDVEYTLEDGSKVDARVTCQRKKDIIGDIESSQRSASAGAMKACFGEDGAFWGTSTAYTIGKAGLVPSGER